LCSSLESLADIAHTKDGASVVRELLARGTAKVGTVLVFGLNTFVTPRRLMHEPCGVQDRKNILRVLKPHLQKLCEDQDAQMVLFTALDCVEWVDHTVNG
jgi:pumilio family protein 6